MNKAERLLQIVNLLRSRRTAMTAAQLSDRLGVSQRTIYRDVQALTLSGISVEGEAGVGYQIRAGGSIPPLMFTPDELEALMLGARMVKAWGGSELGSSVDSALTKIHAVLPDEVHQTQNLNSPWLIVPDFYQQESAPFSDDLRKLIKASCKAKLSYQQADGHYSERVIWPLGLVYWGRTWTLVAWCELRQSYRSFRLDRMHHLEPLAQRFVSTGSINLQGFLAQVCSPEDQLDSL
ncbi:YafY family protein [Neptunomonas phycophila]|uniref:helix-turn-helix transcriptional regulator n=1 Tax=Neptunomonas phycophila TaxID=1572645 RepID=UPI0026E362DF|nr:YafY family protein [Neptunomonas phycophila]MDO6468333.1 YafY family protein [Neptunomonas phycophila]